MLQTRKAKCQHRESAVEMTIRTAKKRTRCKIEAARRQAEKIESRVIVLKHGFVLLLESPQEQPEETDADDRGMDAC
jgi:hypothetical protein